MPIPGEAPDPLGLGPIVEKRQREYPTYTRRLTSAGYVVVKIPGGLWENEARLVIEKRLGRPLEGDEEVRHRDGVPRWDNRLEGLELWREGRPRRLPRRSPAKRVRWKERYLQLAMLLEGKELRVVDDAGDLQPLDPDQAAELERLLRGA